MPCGYAQQAGWCTAFGFEVDLDATELMVTSLLAQALGAMARPGAQREVAVRGVVASAHPGLVDRTLTASNASGLAAGRTAADLASLDVAAGALPRAG